MRGLCRGLLGYVRGIPAADIGRRAAEPLRRASANAKRWWAAASTVAHRRRALRAANLDRAWTIVRGRVARIRLPEIPGGDPVNFGAAVGIAIILAAGLVVLVGSALREQRIEPQSVADLPGYEGERRADEGRAATAPQVAEGAGSEERETAIASVGQAPPQDVTGSSADVAMTPAPVDVPFDSTLADENENIVAARPLLDNPPDDRLDTAPTLGNPSLPPALHPPPESRPPWLANAVEVQSAGDRPMIAIVIDDAGVAQERTARAIALPAPLTIAFIPYGRNLEAQARRARRNGHELLVHIPMEPDSSAVDPGPNALLTSLDGDEIMRRFRWALERFDGYVGVNNHMGSKFMARAELVAPLLSEISARGLLFLDSRTEKSTVGAELAQDIGLPHASRQVFLDNDLDAARIAAQLVLLEKIARRQGHAIAIGHPHDVTVDVLAKWIPGARARGFDLVPVSAIVKLTYGGEGRSLLAAARGGEPDRLLGGAQ